jgi:hypothetical protein
MIPILQAFSQFHLHYLNKQKGVVKKEAEIAKAIG